MCGLARRGVGQSGSVHFDDYNSSRSRSEQLFTQLDPQNGVFSSDDCVAKLHDGLDGGQTWLWFLLQCIRYTHLTSHIPNDLGKKVILGLAVSSPRCKVSQLSLCLDGISVDFTDMGNY